jgi:hypothetical protein
VLVLGGWVLATTLATSGCETVAFGGRTGVSVDSAGHPVVVLVVCEGAVDVIDVYTGEGEHARVVGRWVSATPVSGAQSVNLSSPPATWPARTTLEPLKEGVEYTAGGGTTTNEWATAYVSFTTDALLRVKPGQVLFQEYDQSSDDGRDVVVDAATFQTQSCDDD